MEDGVDGPFGTCYLIGRLWTGGSHHVDLTVTIVVTMVVGIARVSRVLRTAAPFNRPVLRHCLSCVGSRGLRRLIHLLQDLLANTWQSRQSQQVFCLPKHTLSAVTPCHIPTATES